MSTKVRVSTNQSFGRNMFTWTDYSLCEQAFTLTRKWKALVAQAWSLQSSFTAGDLAVHGGSSCDEVVVATTHYDELTNSLGLFPTPDEADQKRPLGSYHEYCVRERRGTRRSSVCGMRHALRPCFGAKPCRLIVGRPSV